jgi:glycosyltransferase involved in cell wall biosynthesis
MERFCLQAADQVISPSHYMLRELEKRFTITNKNVTIVPNPFEGKYNNITPLPVTNEANEIVFYGKLTVQKGAFRLLAYFQKLWDEGFDRPLYLLGGQDIVYHPEGITMGDLIRKKYKKYIDTNRLRLEDRIKPTEIAGRLARAEVVIIPSDNDNLPYVVFEMMALGRIVLVSKQGGHSEVVENGADGFIFDHYEPETFFSQLKAILALDLDQKKDIAGRAIKKVAGNYNLDIIYQKKISVIEQMLQRNRVRSVFPFVRIQPGAGRMDHPGFQKGKLSIVVPYFNMGAFIDETVQSLLKTEYADKEILIVNDGSTDPQSIDILNRYRNKQNIRVLDKPNEGLAKTRNFGAMQADGEFLAFLDADDLVDPSYYSRCIAVFRRYENVHFAGCWVQYFGNSKSIWPTFMPEPPLILYHNLINSSGLVYKRNAFLAGGKNDPDMVFAGLEDYDSVISMLENGFGGIVIPEPWFKYRIRPDSMIRAISRSKKLNLYQHISHKHKQFYATFAADVFNLLNANGPGIALDNPTLDYHLADRLPFGGKMSGLVISMIKKNRLIKTMAYKMYKLIKN